MTNGRRSTSVDMNSDEKWSRRRAVEVHDETADGFFAEYRGDNIFDSPFRYGRHFIDRAWVRCVSQLAHGATCLDIGCGVGAHMARLLDQGFEVTGIEPSAEMRRLAAKNVPADLVSDGSVLQLPTPDSSIDFVYAIEVFRYLDTRDNAQGHREIVRVLKPGGVKLGIPWLSWHVFRHTHATLGEQMGMALSDRQAQMGHGDVRMTLHYTHSDLNRRRQAIEAMSDRLIGEPVGSVN